MENQLELKSISPQLLDISEFKQWSQMEIKCEDDEKLAGTRLNMIAKRVRELEANRDFVLKPFKDHIKVLNTKAKEVSDPLSHVGNHLRKILGAWLHEKRLAEEKKQKEIRDEAARKLREKAEQDALVAANKNDDNAFQKATDDFAAAVDFGETQVAVRPTVRSSQGSVGTMVKWNWKVVDASAVPREVLFCIRQRLGSIVSHPKSKTQSIPGIEFFETTIPVVRSY